MTAETPERPPIRRAAVDLLTDRPEGVSDALLVEAVHAETNASPRTIRATLATMERHGRIYQVDGDWRVVRV